MSRADKPSPQPPEEPPSRSSRAKKVLSYVVQQGLQDVFTDGIVVLDRRMNYLYVNRRAEELLGRAPEDLLGKNY